MKIINDLIYDIESTDVDNFNFADDNTLSACAENLNDIKCKLEQGASTALKWSASNSMIANPDKFKAIILKKPSIEIAQDLAITVGDQDRM